MVSLKLETVPQINKLLSAFAILVFVHLGPVSLAAEFAASDADEILIAAESSIINYNKAEVNNSSTSNNKNKEFQWFQQKLTHFNESDTRQWFQRYFEYGGYYKQGGPVFLQIDGEGSGLSSPSDLIKKGSMVQYAIEQGAYILVLEHRFMGQSQPTKDLSVENLKFLNIQEAVGDLANFVKWFQGKDNFQNNKWVVFGSSYAGSLAKYFKDSYPNMTNILVASSAPLELKYEMNDYLEMIGNVINKTNSKCYEDLRKGFSCLEATLNGKAYCDDSMESVDLQKIFNLCGTLNTDQKYDVDGLFYTIFNIFNNIVVNNVPYPNLSVSLEGICHNFNSSPFEIKESSLEKLARVVRAITNASEVSCIEYRLDKIVKYLQYTSWTSPAGIIGDRQFEWQRCSQLGWIKGSSEPKLPFGSRISTSFHAEICKQVFGISEDMTKQGIQQANAIFKGKSIQTECGIYVNGNADPWSVLGVTMEKDVGDCNRVILIEGASHAKDMGRILSESVNSYPPGITRSQNEIGKILNTWLKSGNCCEFKFSENKTTPIISIETTTRPFHEILQEKFTTSSSQTTTASTLNITKEDTSSDYDDTTFKIDLHPPTPDPFLDPNFRQIMNSSIQNNEIIAEDSKRYETRTFRDSDNVDKIAIDKGVEFKELSDFIKKHENEFFTPDAGTKRYRVRIRRKDEDGDEGKETFSKFGIKIRMLEPKQDRFTSDSKNKFNKQWERWTDFETRKSVKPKPQPFKIKPNNQVKEDRNTFDKINTERPLSNSHRKPSNNQNDRKSSPPQKLFTFPLSESHEDVIVPTTKKQQHSYNNNVAKQRNNKMDDRGEKSLLIMDLRGKNKEIFVDSDNNNNTTTSNNENNEKQEENPRRVKVKRVKVKSRKTLQTTSQSKKIDTTEEVGEEARNKAYKYHTRLEEESEEQKNPNGPKRGSQENLEGAIDEYTSEFSDQLSLSLSQTRRNLKISKTSHEDGPKFLKKGKVNIEKLTEQSSELDSSNSVEEELSPTKGARIPGIWKDSPTYESTTKVHKKKSRTSFKVQESEPDEDIDAESVELSKNSNEENYDNPRDEKIIDLLKNKRKNNSKKLNKKSQSVTKCENCSDSDDFTLKVIESSSEDENSETIKFPKKRKPTKLKASKPNESEDNIPSSESSNEEIDDSDDVKTVQWPTIKRTKKNKSNKKPVDATIEESPTSDELKPLTHKRRKNSQILLNSSSNSNENSEAKVDEPEGEQYPEILEIKPKNKKSKKNKTTKLKATELEESEEIEKSEVTNLSDKLQEEKDEELTTENKKSKSKRKRKQKKTSKVQFEEDSEASQEIDIPKDEIKFDEDEDEFSNTKSSKDEDQQEIIEDVEATETLQETPRNFITDKDDKKEKNPLYNKNAEEEAFVVESQGEGERTTSNEVKAVELKPGKYNDKSTETVDVNSSRFMSEFIEKRNNILFRPKVRLIYKGNKMTSDLPLAEDESESRPNTTTTTKNPPMDRSLLRTNWIIQNSQLKDHLNRSSIAEQFAPLTEEKNLDNFPTSNSEPFTKRLKKEGQVNQTNEITRTFSENQNNLKPFSERENNNPSSNKMFMTSEGKEIPLTDLNWRASTKPEARVVDMSVDSTSSQKLSLTPSDVAWVNYGIP